MVVFQPQVFIMLVKLMRSHKLSIVIRLQGKWGGRALDFDNEIQVNRFFKQLILFRIPPVYSKHAIFDLVVSLQFL